jgi:hypothetical protein
VPTDNGQRPTGPAAGSEGSASPLTPAQRQNLERHGADGRTLVAIVDITAVAPRVRASGHRAGEAESDPDAAAPAALSGHGADSPVTSILAAATGTGGGASGWLPVLLVVVLVGVLAWAIAMRRRSTQQ